MTEFAAGSAALSLLLLGTLALAGYQKVDRRLVVAARQSAWQDTWSSAQVQTGDSARALHRDFLSDSGVLDPAGRQLLVAEGNVDLVAGRRAPGGIAGAAASVLLTPLRTASGFLGAGFDLSDGGVSEGVVRASILPITALPAPFDALHLELNAPFALLGDAWSAGGPSHVATRAGGLVPSGRLSSLNVIWRPLAVPLSLVEPSLNELCFGVLEPDRIPEDRLGPGRSPLLDGCP